ncbi:MAG: hypothetical protein Q4B03_04225 [Lachnospiraceae bacterium]|nr:hypothetical protein [Lachnospiraceae bacterium]
MLTIDTEETSGELQDKENPLLEPYSRLQESYSELAERYSRLEQRYITLQKDYEELKNSRSKAGRKPNDEKWTARYQAFAKLKQDGCTREQIQQELNMSRATFFRYQKIYSDGGITETSADDNINHSSTGTAAIDHPAAVRDAENLQLTEMYTEESRTTDDFNKAGLVLDPASGEYVTPEGLKRRKKLAEIRARRAAEEMLRKQQAEQEASPDRETAEAAADQTDQ